MKSRSTLFNLSNVCLMTIAQAMMTEEYLKGDERVYQEGFPDLDLEVIPKLKIIN